MLATFRENCKEDVLTIKVYAIVSEVSQLAAVKEYYKAAPSSYMPFVVLKNRFHLSWKVNVKTHLIFHVCTDAPSN